jgi:hypothetical protein
VAVLGQGRRTASPKSSQRVGQFHNAQALSLVCEAEGAAAVRALAAAHWLVLVVEDDESPRLDEGEDLLEAIAAGRVKVVVDHALTPEGAPARPGTAGSGQ